MNKTKRNSSILMACSVGGAPRPLAVSITTHRPARVVFFASKDSERSVTQRSVQGEKSELPDTRGILQLCEEWGYPINDRHAIYHVGAQDLEECVERMRSVLREELRAGGEDLPRLLLEFTGGTKLMTAALALVGQRLPCEYSYVAARETSEGKNARTKGGLGVTLDGQEHVLRLRNPWDALGYQAVEDALLLFNLGDYAAAAELLHRHAGRCTAGEVRRRLAAWSHLCEGYGNWDQFRHAEARKALDVAIREFTAIARDLSEPDARALREMIESHRDFLGQLGKTPTVNYVLDLLANASRRARRERFDEAILCVYRAIEAAAQIRLREAHGVDTSSVLVADIPAAVLTELPPSVTKGNREGKTQLALRDSYRYLKAIDDDLGARFFERALDQPNSPLQNRNQSILAHGFRRLGRKAFRDLFYKALKLTQIKEADLPEFPRIDLQ